jgi:hypothetical protein
MGRTARTVCRIRGTLARPRLTVLLLALLLADAALIAVTEPADSELGDAVHRLVTGGSLRQRWLHFAQAYVNGEGGSPVFFDSWDEPTRLLNAAPRSTLVLQANVYSERLGLWAVTHERWDASVDPKFGQGLSAGQVRDSRQQVVEQLATRPGWLTPDIAARLRSSDYKGIIVLPVGVVHDGLALAGLAAFVGSLAWVPAALRERRQRRMLALGRCPGCAYSLSGLESVVCPECGGTLSSAPSGAGSR